MQSGEGSGAVARDTGHFVVCGMGQVGYRVVGLFARLGQSVRVISLITRDDWVREARAAGVQVLVGDARDEALFQSADLHSARAVLAVTDQDLVNIEIALHAKQVRPELPVVVRLFDQELARQVESSFGVQRALGMSAFAAPSFAAAALGQEILASFTIGSDGYVVRRTKYAPADEESSSVADTVRKQGGAVLALHVRGGVRLGPFPSAALVTADELTVLTPADGRWSPARVSSVGGHPSAPGESAARPKARTSPPLHDTLRQSWRSVPLPLRSVLLALLGLTAMSVFIFSYAMNLTLVDAVYFIVATMTTTGYGDITPRDAGDALKLYTAVVMILGSVALATLYSIITDFVVTARFQQMLGRSRAPPPGHIIVVGVGNLGYRVVEELHRLGERVVAVDRNPSGEFVETLRANTHVVFGDARVPETLLRAGVDSAQALIAATNDDAANLGVALSARQMNPAIRTVVRLFDADFAARVRRTLAVDTVMSSSLIAAPMFVAAGLHSGALSAFVLEGHLVAIVEAEVGNEWGGRLAGDLSDGGRGILMVQEGRGTFGPVPPDRPLVAGQRALVVLWHALAAEGFGG